MLDLFDLPTRLWVRPTRRDPPCAPNHFVCPWTTPQLQDVSVVYMPSVTSPALRRPRSLLRVWREMEPFCHADTLGARDRGRTSGLDGTKL